MLAYRRQDGDGADLDYDVFLTDLFLTVRDFDLGADVSTSTTADLGQLTSGACSMVGDLPRVSSISIEFLTTPAERPPEVTAPVAFAGSGPCCCPASGAGLDAGSVAGLDAGCPSVKSSVSIMLWAVVLTVLDDDVPS